MNGWKDKVAALPQELNSLVFMKQKNNFLVWAPAIMSRKTDYCDTLGRQDLVKMYFSMSYWIYKISPAKKQKQKNSMTWPNELCLDFSPKFSLPELISDFLSPIPSSYPISHFVPQALSLFCVDNRYWGVSWLNNLSLRIILKVGFWPFTYNYSKFLFQSFSEERRDKWDVPPADFP